MENIQMSSGKGLSLHFYILNERRENKMKIITQVKTSTVFYHFCRLTYKETHRRRKLVDKSIWNSSLQKWVKNEF